jgi:tetratricopeptide (TPR) repeat protein
MRDREAQKDTHDRERLVQSAEREAELIQRAQAEFEADTQSIPKLNALITLLTRSENDESENTAIRILTEQYKSEKNYAFKARADDIRLKQTRRHLRGIAEQYKANREDDEIKAQAIRAKRALLEMEVEVYEERAREYPTDLRVLYSLADAYFNSKRYDDAIPCFQKAQADGKNREKSRLMLGRCFLEKKLYNEAVGSLRKAFEEHELGGNDAVGREMYYRLGRALEASGDLDEAIKVYAQIIQWDYNYMDARGRLESLRSGQESAADSSE